MDSQKPIGVFGAVHTETTTPESGFSPFCTKLDLKGSLPVQTTKGQSSFSPDGLKI